LAKKKGSKVLTHLIAGGESGSIVCALTHVKTEKQAKEYLVKRCRAHHDSCVR